MKTAIATITGVCPYSQSRKHDAEKLNQELDRDYVLRTWREHLHVDRDGYVYIPPGAFKNGIAEVAKYLGVKVPGKGQATYTKSFEAGIIVPEPLTLPLKKEDVQGEWLFLPSDGKRGGGKRVWKCYPVIHEWGGQVTFMILDDLITPEVFERHLREFGRFIGIGRFRPRMNGTYGRFKVESVTWQ